MEYLPVRGIPLGLDCEWPEFVYMATYELVDGDISVHVPFTLSCTEPDAMCVVSAMAECLPPTDRDGKVVHVSELSVDQALDAAKSFGADGIVLIDEDEEGWYVADMMYVSGDGDLEEELVEV